MDASVSAIANNYRLKVPTGAKECAGETIEEAYKTLPAQQFAATDVLQLYFFGPRSYTANGEAVFDAAKAEVQPPRALSDKVKNDLLHSPAFLNQVYQALAAANGGSLANLFNQDGTAKDSEYGDKLYTCGAKDKWFWQNPNSGRVGTAKALWLRKDALFNNEIGALPNRKVPVAVISDLIAKWTSQPAEAPRPAVQAAAPTLGKPKPVSVAPNSGVKTIKIPGTGLTEGTVFAIADDNCKEAVDQESIKITPEGVTFKIVTGTLTLDDGARSKTCKITVNNPAGEASADLGVKKSSGGGGKKPAAGICETNPEACL